MSDSTIKIMLVDDHAVARAGYRFMLDYVDGLSVIAEAGSGEEALRMYPAMLPDVVILDLTMPGLGGRETLIRMKSQWPECRILICTMHETAALVDHAMKAGADGYISKNSSPEVLVTAVRRIAQGHKYIDAELAQSVVTSGNRTANVGIEALSPREFQVLCLFAEALTVDEIAAKLTLSSKTVANNLTVIKEKLQVGSTAELIRLAISTGLASV
ncbi:MAG: response regulator transcription factor [Pseudomonadota bacterium]